MRSAERSTAYYQTEIGKMKKKQHNDNRQSKPDPTAESDEKKGPKETDDTEEEKAREKREEPEASAAPEERDPETTGPPEFDEGMVEHLRLQTSLLEEREVSREETIEMLRRIMRQHSMAGEKRRDYVLRFLKEMEEENPP